MLELAGAFQGNVKISYFWTINLIQSTCEIKASLLAKIVSLREHLEIREG